jgi:type IV pilus assembly protein PilW
VTHSERSSPRRQSGFSLIEVMVGLLIGMLSVILIMQVFSGAEGAKRTTTGGDDAQINGNIALYGLERDIRDAGYGLNSFNLLGCTLTLKTTIDKVDVTLDSVAPVNINPATAIIPVGDANTDTLLVISTALNGPPEGDLMSAAPTTGSYPVTTPDSFAKDDIVIAQPAGRPTPCALTTNKVTDVSPAGITVNPGDTTGLILGSVVFNMGRALTVHAYAVRKGNLTMCDYTQNDCGKAASAVKPDPDVWVPVANSIVSLRAQYGRDISGGATSLSTGIVGTFDQTTPGSTEDKKNGRAVQCNWARTLAVRLAVVARSPQYDKLQPTKKAPEWTGTKVSTTVPTNPTALTIDLSNDGDWGFYRYKTLETTVPIRNVLWQGGQTSC